MPSCQFESVHHQPISVGYNRNSALMALLDKHADKFAAIKDQRKIDYADCRKTVAACAQLGLARRMTPEEIAARIKPLNKTSQAIGAAVDELLSMGHELPYGALSQAAKRHNVRTESVRTRYLKVAGQIRIRNEEKRSDNVAKAVEWLVQQGQIIHGMYSHAARMFGCTSAAVVRNRYMADKIDRRNAQAA